jgi:hypothetical protein
VPKLRKFWDGLCPLPGTGNSLQPRHPSLRYGAPWSAVGSVAKDAWAEGYCHFVAGIRPKTSLS